MINNNRRPKGVSLAFKKTPLIILFIQSDALKGGCVMFLNEDTEFKKFCQTDLKSTSIKRESENINIKSLMRKIEIKGKINSHMFAHKNGYQDNLAQVISKIYNLTRYSLDLPVSSSVSAHSFVFLDILKFSNIELEQSLEDSIKNSHKIGAICNAEYGAGSNLKRIKSSLSVDETLKIEKPHITNGSIADFGVFSLYNHKKKSEQLEIYLINLEHAKRVDITSRMTYFQSGATGGVFLDRELNPTLDWSLSGERSPFQILKRCFDTERLILGVMAAGLLRGLEDEIIKALDENNYTNENVMTHQYLQEKIVNLVKTRTILESLIEHIVLNVQYDYDNLDVQLSTLKIVALEDAFDSALEVMEFFGAKASLKESLYQKACRDLMAYRFFGGTKELHKNVIFERFKKKYSTKLTKKAS